ncbi:MAG: class A beta-lactamase [Muribaculaceae bacterium]
MIRILALVVATLMWCGAEGATKLNRLNEQLHALTDTFPAHVGIAVITDAHEVITVNGNDRFPMLSVMKWPQALAVAEVMHSRGLSLEHEVEVTPADLVPNTWSPMRDEHPNGGRFTVARLLEYSLEQSDNNACDILFSRIADVASVNAFVASLGITDCQIAYSEAQMNEDIAKCYDNYITPLAAAEMMKKCYEQRDADCYRRFVWNTMTNCRTGANRLPGLVANQATAITHKTGTGPIMPNGKIMAVNDVGCITLANGAPCHIAVFVENASCTMPDCEKLIAHIAKNCVDALQ